MHDIVNGLLVRQGRILLAHRSADRSNYPDTWSFPGGHVEHGETLEEALTRELFEETGVQPLSWRHLDGFRLSTEKAQFHFFVVDKWQGEPENLGHEHQELRWVDLAVANKMPALTFPIYTDIFSALAKA